MLNTNLEKVMKLDDICKELDLSKFQFIRLFKAHTGISTISILSQFQGRTIEYLLYFN